MTRVAINGLGRIGRTIVRLLSTSRVDSPLELVACNDIAAGDLCAYLLKYDSIFGPLGLDVIFENDRLLVGTHGCRFTMLPDLALADLRDVDLVLDCTGKAVTTPFARAGLAAGAQKVLVSGPSPIADATVIMGGNDSVLQDQEIVSIGSCTTNALAPLLKVLDDTLQITAGHMTTIHCYTGSQPTIDAPRGGYERSRAAALSMVPTTTSAGRLIGDVLPSLSGRISTSAIRVPTASVSGIDLSFTARRSLSEQVVNDVLREAASSVIGVITEPLVSSDLRMRPESIVMALPETRVSQEIHARVYGWYDNEWAFANRMIDVAERMTRN